MPGYVAIGVTNLAASRRFWCEELGLGVAGEWPCSAGSSDSQAARREPNQLAVDCGGFEVLLDATGEIPVAPGIEIAIRVERIEVRVKPFRGPKDFGGPNGLEAAFRDPDGYVVTLYTGRA